MSGAAGLVRAGPLRPAQAGPTLVAMGTILRPWQVVLVGLAGWITRQQLEMIEYLK